MAESKELFLIDSNVLIYAFELEKSVKKNNAKNLLKECLLGIKQFVISSQNFSEFVSVATKKGKLSFEEAKNIVMKMVQFEGFIKINYSAETILSAIDIAHEFEMSFWDSLLAATMKENGIFNIYTENTKDFKIPWIKAVNPFK